MIIAYIIIGVVAVVLGILGIIIAMPYFKKDDNLEVNSRVWGRSEGNPNIAIGKEDDMAFIDNSINKITKRCKYGSRRNKKDNL